MTRNIIFLVIIFFSAASLVEVCSAAQLIEQIPRKVKLTLLKEATVNGNRVYLGDISSCSGDMNLCREASGIDVHMSPLPGRMVQVQQNTVNRALEKEWPNAGISFDGAEFVKVTGANADVRIDEVRQSLQAWMNSQIDFSQDIKVTVSKVMIPMGSGVRPSQTKVEYPDLEGLPYKQVDWLCRNLTGVRLTQFKFVNPADSEDYQLVSGQAHFVLERLIPVAAYPLKSGILVSSKDIANQWVTLKRGPFEYANLSEQIAGKRLKNMIASGEPFNMRYLDEALLINRNQPVNVVMKNSGVEITAKATAMDSGVLGQVVDVVNVANKKRIRARVIDGQTVEAISF